MSKFIVNGGVSLRGEIGVCGAKNGILPVLAATLLTEETCVIRNVPRLSDVDKMVAILKSLGADCVWEGEHELRICAKNADSARLDAGLVAGLRGSVLLMGPLLARFHDLKMPEPGGDIIGKRPLDTHYFAFAKMGAAAEEREDKTVRIRAPKGLVAALIILPEFSVTATENALMAAAFTPGKTIIKLAAAEPHVEDLCAMLQKMGAKVKGAGTHTLEIEGAAKLRGCDHAIIPDALEVGTFAVAAAATKGEVLIKNAVPEHLDAVLNLMNEIGIPYRLEKNSLLILPAKQLRPFRLQTLPYPGFPTDLQAPFAVLATQAEGMSLIHDPMYEGRLGYIPWLVKMGANAIVCDPHRAVISGPTRLHGYEIKALDIRAGATLLIAGLIAKGETVLYDAEILDRGYERLYERLTALGASIRRE
jgi:UDP-N-acetylglucosamine 1-carboxyvinyltransferase